MWLLGITAGVMCVVAGLVTIVQAFVGRARGYYEYDSHLFRFAVGLVGITIFGALLNFVAPGMTQEQDRGIIANFGLIGLGVILVMLGVFESTYFEKKRRQISPVIAHE